MNMKPDLETIYFDSPLAWRAWLADDGETETEIWVGLYKKDSGKTGITYDQSVEEALCYGWIDGLTKRVDDTSYKIRFTPRKSRSNWSASNIARVNLLIKDGKMMPEGLKHIDAAKSDGRWSIE